MIKAKIVLTYILAIVALYSSALVPYSDQHLLAGANLTESHASYTRATECEYKLTPNHVDTINQAIDYIGFIKLCVK